MGALFGIGMILGVAFLMLIATPPPPQQSKADSQIDNAIGLLVIIVSLLCIFLNGGGLIALGIWIIYIIALCFRSDYWKAKQNKIDEIHERMKEQRKASEEARRRSFEEYSRKIKAEEDAFQQKIIDRVNVVKEHDEWGDTFPPVYYFLIACEELDEEGFFAGLSRREKELLARLGNNYRFKSYAIDGSSSSVSDFRSYEFESPIVFCYIKLDCLANWCQAIRPYIERRRKSDCPPEEIQHLEAVLEEGNRRIKELDAICKQRYNAQTRENTAYIMNRKK